MANGRERVAFRVDVRTDCGIMPTAPVANTTCSRCVQESQTRGQHYPRPRAGESHSHAYLIVRNVAERGMGRIAFAESGIINLQKSTTDPNTKDTKEL